VKSAYEGKIKREAQPLLAAFERARARVAA
jgi:hypothetical protein